MSEAVVGCNCQDPAVFGHDDGCPPPVRLVQLYRCDLCLTGAGGECHVPACSFWMNRAPDISLLNSQGVTILDGQPVSP